MALYSKSENCIHCNDCNSKVSMFKMLNDDELAILNANRYEVGFKQGENIIKQGTSSTHIIILTSGIAKMYLEGLDNKNVILELILPNKICGSSSCFADNRYHYSITAIEPCTVCFIDMDNVKHLLKRNFEFMEAFIGHSSFDNLKTYERLISLTQKQMHGRIADVLIYLYKEIYQSDNFEFVLTRQDIGDLSGMTKDSAIRVLKDFESEGIIKTEGRNIEIIDKDILQKISLKG